VRPEFATRLAKFEREVPGRAPDTYEELPINFTQTLIPDLLVVLPPVQIL
jgi:hypothetical protein